MIPWARSRVAVDAPIAITSGSAAAEPCVAERVGALVARDDDRPVVSALDLFSQERPAAVDQRRARRGEARSRRLRACGARGRRARRRRERAPRRRASRAGATGRASRCRRAARPPRPTNTSAGRGDPAGIRGGAFGERRERPRDRPLVGGRRRHDQRGGGAPWPPRGDDGGEVRAEIVRRHVERERPPADDVGGRGAAVQAVAGREDDLRRELAMRQRDAAVRRRAERRRDAGDDLERDRPARRAPALPLRRARRRAGRPP